MRRLARPVSTDAGESYLLIGTQLDETVLTRLDETQAVWMGWLSVEYPLELSARRPHSREHPRTLLFLFLCVCECISMSRIKIVALWPLNRTRGDVWDRCRRSNGGLPDV